MPTSFRTTRRNRASIAGPENGPEYDAEYDDLGRTDPDHTGSPPTDPEPPGPESPGDSDGYEEAHWNDEGESWWSPHPVPPSYRDAT